MTSKQREAELTAMEELNLVPESTSVFPNGELKKFESALERRIELKALVKSAEEDIKDLDTRLTAMLTDHDTVKVKHNGYGVTIAQGSSGGALSKELLVQKGVSAALIAECLTPKKTYTYLLVVAPKPGR